MADLELVRLPSGKFDFVLSGADLAVTDSPVPAILRLLVQDSWLGDDGERSGDSLGAVRLSNAKTKDQVTNIVEQRLGVLIRSGQLTAASVLDVTTIGDRLYVSVSYTAPGQEPATVQVPITA